MRKLLRDDKWEIPLEFLRRQALLASGNQATGRWQFYRPF